MKASNELAEILKRRRRKSDVADTVGSGESPARSTPAAFSAVRAREVRPPEPGGAAHTRDRFSSHAYEGTAPGESSSPLAVAGGGAAGGAGNSGLLSSGRLPGEPGPESERASRHSSDTRAHVQTHRDRVPGELADRGTVVPSSGEEPATTRSSSAGTEALHTKLKQAKAALAEQLAENEFEDEQEFVVELQAAQDAVEHGTKLKREWAEKDLASWAGIIELRKSIAALAAELAAAKGPSNAAEISELRARLNALLAEHDFKDEQAFQQSYNEALGLSETGRKREKTHAKNALLSWAEIIECRSRLHELEAAAASAAAFGNAGPSREQLRAQLEGKRRDLDNLLLEHDIADEDEFRAQFREALKLKETGTPREKKHAERSLVAWRDIGEVLETIASLERSAAAFDSGHSEPGHESHRDTATTRTKPPLDPVERGADGHEEAKTSSTVSAATRSTLVARTASDLPPCWERTLLEIIQTAQTAPRDVPLKRISQQLQSLLVDARAQLETEGDSTLRATEMLANMDGALDEHDYKTVGNVAVKLLQQLRPVDLSALVANFNATHSAAEQIKNDDIVLLLGKTGSGKSTAMHFAAGSKFVVKEIAGTEHLEPVDAREELRSVITSPSTNSETRFLTAVRIPTDTIAGPGSYIMLCDTPGFEDVAGPEVDIANGLGVSKAVGNARSVRTVVLFSQYSMGDRFDGIAKTAHTLTRAMDVSEEVLRSLAYCFTKYEAKHERLLPQRFTAKLEDVSQLERADRDFMMLLQDVADKTKGGAHILRPLEDDRNEFLRMLDGLPKISNPKDVFRVFVSEESVQKLDAQLKFCRSSLERALDRLDIPLATFRLSQLMMIKRVFDSLGKSKGRGVSLVDCDPQQSILKLRQRIDGLRTKLQGALDKIVRPATVEVEDHVCTAADAAQLLQRLDLLRKICLKDVDSHEEHLTMRIHRASLDILEQLPPGSTFSAETIDFVGAALLKLTSLRDGMPGALPPKAVDHLNAAVARFRDVGFEILCHFQATAAEALRDATIPTFLEGARQLKALGNCSGEFSGRVETVLDKLRSDLTTELDDSASAAEHGVRDLARRALTEPDSDVDFAATVQSIKTGCSFVSATARYSSEVDSFLADTAAVSSRLQRLRSCTAPLERCLTELKDPPRSALALQMPRCVRLLDATAAVKAVSVLQDSTMKLHSETANLLRRIVRDKQRAVLEVIGRHFDEFDAEKRRAASEELCSALRDLEAAKPLQKYEEEGIYNGEYDEVCTEIGKLVAQHMHVIDATDVLESVEDCVSSFKALSVLVGADDLLPKSYGARSASRRLLQRFRDSLEAAGRELRDPVSSGDRRFSMAAAALQLRNVDWALQLPADDTFSVAVDEELARWSETLADVTTRIVKGLEEHYSRFESASAEPSVLEAEVEKFTQQLDQLSTAQEPLVRCESECRVARVQAQASEVVGRLQQAWAHYIGESLPSYHQDMMDAAKLMRAAADSGDADDVVDPNYPNRVVVARRLASIDRWLPGGVSFRECCDELNEALSQRRHDQTAQLQALANSCDFVKYAELHDRITSLDPAQRSALDSQLERLSNSLGERAAQHTDLSESIPFDATSKDLIVRMMEDHDVLELAQQSLSKLLSEISLATMRKATADLQRRLSRMLLAEEETLITMLSEDRFKPVTQKIKFIMTLVASSKASAVSAQCAAPFHEKLEAVVSNGLDSLRECLKFRVQHYKELDWKEFSSDSPKNLFRALQKLSAETGLAEPTDAPQLLKELSNHFNSRAQAFIAAAQADSAGPDDERNLQLLRDTQTHLPEDVCAMFAEALETATRTISDRLRAEEAKAAEEEATGKLSVLIDGMHASISAKNFNRMRVYARRIENAIRERSKMYVEKLQNGQLREIRKGVIHSYFEWQYFIEQQAKRTVPIPSAWKLSVTRFEFVADAAQCQERCNAVLNALQSSLHESFVGLITKLNAAQGIRDLSAMRQELRDLAEYIRLWLDYQGSSVKSQPYHIFVHVCDRVQTRSVVSRTPEPSARTRRRGRGAAGGAGGAAMSPGLVRSTSSASTGEDFSSFSLADLVRQLFDSLAAFLQKAKDGFTTTLRLMEVASLATQLSSTGAVTAELKILEDLALEAKPLRAVRKPAAAISEMQLYDFMRHELASKLLDIKRRSCERIVVDDGTAWSSNAHDREEFYKLLARDYKALKEVRVLSSHVDSRVADVTELHSDAEKHLGNQLAEVRRRAEKRLTGIPTSRTADYEDLNTAFENLRAVTLHFDGTPLAAAATGYMKDTGRGVEQRLRAMRERAAASIDPSDPRALVSTLVQFKQVGIFAPAFKGAADHALDGLLLDVERSQGAFLVASVGAALSEVSGDDAATAQMIIAEHNSFQDVAINLMNQKTKRQGLDYVMDKIRFHGADSVPVGSQELLRRTTSLRELFATFDEVYRRRVEGGILDPSTHLRHLVRDARAVAANSSLSYATKAPHLMALLFAHWTLTRRLESTGKRAKARSRGAAIGVAGGAGGAAAPATPATEDDEEDKFDGLLQPHAAQVIAIFRMLGLDGPGSDIMESRLHNQLVEIGTGEGKSVTLSVVASVLALLGYNVDCACYSAYLSKRDHEAFLPLFRAFGVAEMITFGTFNEMCEKFINRRGDVRELTVAAIESGPASDAAYLPSHTADKNILLVDEVDVFFDKSFYGNYYRPLAELRDPTVTDLVQYLWSIRSDRMALRLDKVKSTPQYVACTRRYRGWDVLIEEATKCMIADVQSFEGIEYHLSPSGEVGYKEQDGISFNIKYGYKTMFTYFKEHERARVTQAQRDRQVALTVDCGAFSYAEVPKQYDVVMGVSGTLSTLSKPEKDLLREVYQIEDFTFMPSVYGNNKLKFRGDDPSFVLLEDEENHHLTLRNEIDKRLVGSIPGVQRAVMVFFDKTSDLLAFYKSPHMRDIAGRTRIMTPDVGDDDKEGLVRQAVTQGAVTLLSREFGRGTDFKCYDSRLVSSGGVHVIQAFVSDQVSEETQIKGRTARQGDEGSFSMVLNKNSLERFGMSEAIINGMQGGGGIYSVIDQHRGVWFRSAYAESMRYVDDIREDHKEADSNLSALVDNNIPAVQAFLLKRNTCRAKFADAVAKTVLLLDATYSMEPLLDKTKNTVNEMFNRAYEIIDEKAPGAVFDVQLCVYRNYNCTEDKLFQSTGFESAPDILRTFLTTVGPDGGWGREAIEIGFAHVNELLAAGTEVSQIVLLGDRGANTKADVAYKRDKSLGESYWATTKYAVTTHVDDELDALAVAGVPIHTFFVERGTDAETDFARIASATGGECNFLDVKADDGAAQLTHIVTRRILDSVGGQTLVKAYEDKFMKGFVASSSAGGAGGAGGAAAAAP